MEKEAIKVATPKSAIDSAKKRHCLIGAKNFEKEVQRIFAEEESDMENMIAEPESKVDDIQLLMTPKSRKRTVKETTLMQTPKSVAVVQAEELQTPRRSMRKSIKPMQDYEDIVAKKSLRSLKKAEKQSSVEEKTENEEDREDEAPKWTPAKVGRVSQKRKSRKSRKNIGKKQQEDGGQKIQVDVDVLEVIANDEDENKENVEPQELLRNRKSPKDKESKGNKTRSSQETCVSLSAEEGKSKIKHADAQSQPLNSLTLEEERTIEKCSPKVSHVATEYVKKDNQKTERQELLDFGLKPIELLEEPVLSLKIFDKQQKEDEASIDDIKAKAEGKVVEASTLIPPKSVAAMAENKLETIIIADVLPHDQPGNIISTSLQNKESASSTFHSKTENFNTPNPRQSNEANSTLNSSDCVIISPEVEQLESVAEKEANTLASNLITSTSLAKMAENKLETIIIADVLPHDQPGKIMSTSLQNKEAASSTFDSRKENFNTPNQKKSNEANSSDCVIILPEVEQHELVEKDKDTSMPSLLISDHEEQEDSDEKCDNSQPPAKIPKIFVNNVKLELKTPQKDITTKVNIVAPFVATSGTPKIRKTKPYRFPTPYKSRVPQSHTFDFNNKQEETESNTEDEINSSAMPPVVFKLTTLAPKEIVLRSIRKRSLSVCNDQPPRKQFNRVTFNSPANQTTVIEDIDLLIAKSAKKNVPRMRGGHMDSLVSDTSNVTKRRKRSVSMDESLSMARLKVQQAPLTPSKIKSTPQKLQLRTKIPNFAAIHQRQFKKMENIVDHVTRKAERAKVLTTSASKFRGMSAQKGGFSSNNQNIEPGSGAEGGAAVVEFGTTHARVGKPKALKKIDLSDNTIKSAPTLVAAKKSDDDEDSLNNTAINLPNPQLLKNIMIVQSMPSGTKLQEMQPKKIFKPAHSIQMQQAKPAFNLSTNIKTQTANISILDRTATAATSSTSCRKQPTCVNTTIKTTQSLPDKVATRRQRHMDMYKGRGGVKSSRDKEKTIEIIRGVRSNRRFDLQMQHRKNLNHDQI